MKATASPAELRAITSTFPWSYCRVFGISKCHMPSYVNLYLVPWNNLYLQHQKHNQPHSRSLLFTHCSHENRYIVSIKSLCTCIKIKYLCFSTNFLRLVKTVHVTFYRINFHHDIDNCYSQFLFHWQFLTEWCYCAHNICPYATTVWCFQWKNTFKLCLAKKVM